MFRRRLHVSILGPDGAARPAPLHHIDSFAMRSFTNDALFDETLPVADGLLEAGTRVPLAALSDAMTLWFRRKSYLREQETLSVTECAPD